MVHIIRKVALPDPQEVVSHLRLAATTALGISLREVRPVGFPLLFSREHHLIEPAVAFLHEHSVHRGHSDDTIRTYVEILYDWFETLEQNGIAWTDASATDLIAYRNRMMQQPSAHTGRQYRISTINHRVRGVLRFYDWALRTRWIAKSDLAGKSDSFPIAKRPRLEHIGPRDSADHSLFVLRQHEPLPRPLTSEQVQELFAKLLPPYDLMARWQLYTGLRVSELLRLDENILLARSQSVASHQTIEVIRKGRKQGYVIASESLLNETEPPRLSWRPVYVSQAGIA